MAEGLTILCWQRRINEAIPEDRLDEIEVEIMEQEEYMDNIQNR